MDIKYNFNVDKKIIVSNLDRITNLIFKLLPIREEGGDWEPPLQNILIELTGMSNLLIDYHQNLFSIVCRLEGLFGLNEEEDFLLFRKTIFECLNLLGKVKKCIAD